MEKKSTKQAWNINCKPGVNVHCVGTSVQTCVVGEGGGEREK